MRSRGLTVSTQDVGRGVDAQVVSGVRRMVRGVPPAAVVIAAAVLAACGDSPSQPTPIVQPPPQQPVNQQPVIESVTVSAQRVEADADVTVTATVRDAETPVDQMRFDWSADAGAFTGTGPTVQWRLPRGATTPVEIPLRLTVVETYGTAPAGGTRPQHSVSATASPVRVHDSSREIAELSMRFLRDFANSTIAADTALREFSDSCSREKQAEREDIDANRRDFDILSSQLNVANAAVTAAWSRGVATVQCTFSSRRKNCPPGSDPTCRVGAVETVQGNCNLTTVYEQQRWLLCESRFDGRLVPIMQGFFGRER